MNEIRDRVVGLEMIDAADLIPNPKNWRLHPDYQRDALRTIVDEVGIADVCLGVRVDKGVMLIDGHLRTEELTGELPVVILDLTPEEADTVLATLDPVANMAGRSQEALEVLADGLTANSEEFAELVEDLKLSWASDAAEKIENRETSGRKFGSVAINKVAVADAKELVALIKDRLPDYEVMAF